MRRLALSLFFLLTVLLWSQPALTFPPPKVTPPTPEITKKIDSLQSQLATNIERLRRLGVRDPGLADVEIYLEAAKRIAKHEEYFQDSAKWTVSVLEQGLLRASQQARGYTPWLNTPGETVVRAYRSRIDGSLQPYAVTYPHEYGTDPRKRYRTDVVLHGRNAGLTEVSFLYRNRGVKPASKDLGHVQIDIYGRGNNAYRWAGESDVYEAIEHFFASETLMRRGTMLDVSRVVLRGFSMGGAGTWHLGLHRPDQFVVMGPGAGFTTTRGYIPKFPAKLPDYQEACLHIYDAVDYAENAFNIPVVAFSGEIDAQKAAADNIQHKLKDIGISMTHLVAPKTGHKMPPEWAKKVEAEYAKHVEKGKPEYPRKVRFVTYTLKYPSCFWVELLGLEQHYKQARIDAQRQEDGFLVKTQNIRALRLALWPGATREAVNVDIDGQKLTKIFPHQTRPGELYLFLEKHDGKWARVFPERIAVDRLRRPQKTPGMTGPIDDAFTSAFVCVRGTKDAWHPATDAYVRADLARFQKEWSKYMRGELIVLDDHEVTPEDIAGKNLILFGDPASNSVIAQVLPRLPLKWTQKSIQMAGKEYDASNHVPTLIYPSPLSPDRYIVINSGHTFHEADFVGTNALLYPRLGDHAILKVKGNKEAPLDVEVITAGLFDEYWQLPSSKK